MMDGCAYKVIIMMCMHISGPGNKIRALKKLIFLKKIKSI
jgi:hypothetical protein